MAGRLRRAAGPVRGCPGRRRPGWRLPGRGNAAGCGRPNGGRALTAGLFSAVEMQEIGGDPLSGFRLDRLELYNWGTFNQRVWTFQADGRNGLLTGDIGSGKSTIVDAITTLLLPANRISYNKAERSEITGSSRPVPLRDASSYSVILGVFANRGYDACVTIAQVFWTRDGNQGQPDRFFVTADREMSVIGDFADFGTDIAALKKKLQIGRARTHDHFPDYGKDFRRRLGIESEQAMELFHQTVSMKSVGNLNDFVRSHMLEPFDAASWTDRIVAHFEDLTRAHEAVRRAQAQLAALEPLLADCDSYDILGAEIQAATDQRAALRYYFADRKSGLLEQQISGLEKARAGHEQALRRLKNLLEELRKKETSLQLERAGHGGDRLSEIERRLAEDTQAAEERTRKAERFGELLAKAGMEPVETASQFSARRREINEAAAADSQHRADRQNQLTEVAVEAKVAQGRAAELNAELVSLRSRTSSIPKRSLDLRQLLCRELQLAEP